LNTVAVNSTNREVILINMRGFIASRSTLHTFEQTFAVLAISKGD